MRFLTWLFSIKKGSSKTPSVDVYTLEDRSIYSYSDGEKIVKADPMPLYKAVMDVGPSLSVDLKVSTSTLMKNEDKGKAHQSLLGSIRSIFNLKPFQQTEDGKMVGLTEIETVEVLDHFLSYCHELKKKMKPNVTSSNSSGVSPPYMAPTSPLMSSGLESGSTANASNTVEPTPSTSEQPSLSGTSNQGLNSGEASVTEKEKPS